jgi:hypothetical protein
LLYTATAAATTTTITTTTATAAATSTAAATTTSTITTTAAVTTTTTAAVTTTTTTTTAYFPMNIFYDKEFVNFELLVLTHEIKFRIFWGKAAFKKKMKKEKKTLFTNKLDLYLRKKY